MNAETIEPAAADAAAAPLDLLLTDAALGALNRVNPGGSGLWLVAALAARPRLAASRTRTWTGPTPNGSASCCRDHRPHLPVAELLPPWWPDRNRQDRAAFGELLSQAGTGRQAAWQGRCADGQDRAASRRDRRAAHADRQVAAADRQIARTDRDQSVIESEEADPPGLTCRARNQKAPGIAVLESGPWAIEAGIR